MNAQFKKLATQASVAAILAGGSLSAHAVITAVPAPAQLVPLFYYSAQRGINEQGEDIGAAQSVEVRVIVPRAVGADTVIGLLGGAGVKPQASWNGSQTFTVPRIHWYFMDVNSNEVVNSSFPVTPDDEVYFSAEQMPCQVGNLQPRGDQGRELWCGNGGVAAPTLPADVPGYLLMVNESASTGVDGPTFSFSAEAWLENNPGQGGGGANGMSSAVAIPVLGMADTADSTTYPTPTNNVIEDYATAGAGGPIASPIHTGMRTSTTLAGAKYRVFDIPMHNVPGVTGQVRLGQSYVNTIVAWADRNYAAAIANPQSPEIKNGLSGRLFTVNNNEVMTSNGRLILPNQLNIVPVVADPTRDLPANYPFRALYTFKGGAAGGWTPTPTDPVYFNATYANLNNGGFLKFVVDNVDLPAANLDPGAYSSAVIFTIPSRASGGGHAGDDSEIAIDTGFFSAN